MPRMIFLLADSTDFTETDFSQIPRKSFWLTDSTDTYLSQIPQIPQIHISHRCCRIYKYVLLGNHWAFRLIRIVNYFSFL